jgi:hypothetical protein
MLICLLLLTSCSMQSLQSLGSSGDASRGVDPATVAQPAWMPPPVTKMAYGSRVAIMPAFENEITRVHAGTAGIGNSRKSEKPAYDFPGYVTEALRQGLLSNTPYQPLIIRPSARLMRDRATWQESWNEAAQRFSPEWQQEFDAIIKQNRLEMIVVVSPTEMDDGIVGTGQKIFGTGLYTRSFMGQKQAAVFSTLRFYRVMGTPARLLTPVAAPDERLYASIANFPTEPPDPMPAPIQAGFDQAVRNLIDQKIGAFIRLMK